MRQVVWTSRTFYSGGLVMFLCAFALIAVSAVAVAANPSVEARLVSIANMLQAAALMITGGLFHVAGAVLAAAERTPKDQERA